MTIASNKYPKRGNMRAISDNIMVINPRRKLIRRNRLGNPVFINPNTIYTPPITKKLIIKKLITTSMLNMGFSMESINDIDVSKKITVECKIFMILSEALINPGARLIIILANE